LNVVNEVSAAFGEMTDDEFEDRFDFSRPEKDPKARPIVITCRSGARATKAAEMLTGPNVIKLFTVVIYECL
jgi:rhodanese-related sulfurtransferase